LSEETRYQPPKPWSLRRKIGFAVLLIPVTYLAVAYVIMPQYWKIDVRRHPALGDVPNITHLKDGVPGDPLNVALVGTKEQLERILTAAQWFPADPLGVRADLKIAEATVLKREYDDAPVSSLYLFGRKEDLAYEQPVGPDPRQRHHVRFWKTDKVDDEGRPVWIGSAIFDEHVGLSRRTGQITHVTAPDIDAERDYLFQCLEVTGELAERYIEKGFHKQLEGKNGGGDPWRTDGDLYVGVIQESLAS
jgi:LssY C-terminus